MVVIDGYEYSVAGAVLHQLKAECNTMWNLPWEATLFTKLVQHFASQLIDTPYIAVSEMKNVV